VEADEEQVQLGDDRGLVVARIADEGSSVNVSRQIRELAAVYLALFHQQPHAGRL
jgi:hypothetical protein